MKLFKKFAFIALFPIVIIALVAILISNSLEDVSHFNRNFFVFGFFSIISFCYVFIFETLKKRNKSRISSYGYSILSLSVLLYFFSCITFHFLFSGFDFKTAAFQTILGICIFLTITFIFEIYNQSDKKEVLTVNEKPFFFVKLIATVFLVFSILHCIMSYSVILGAFKSNYGALKVVSRLFLLHLQVIICSFILLFLFYKIYFFRKNVILGIFLTSVISCLINSYFGVLWQNQFFKNIIILYPICLSCCATLVIIIIYRTKIQKLSLSFIKKESEYLQLKNQVNPHFLFNNLNTLIAFIETNPQKAIAFGHQLSNVYRHYLQNENDDFVSLVSEIEFISEYTAIFKAKFESGFTFEVENNASPEQYILSFTLQELLDNIFKHCILDAENPIEVKISIHQNELSVRNTKIKKEFVQSTKKGLANINKRYNLLTQKEIIITEDNNFFEVKIPVLYLTK